MGVPAGGSLRADQWLLMATIVGPIAVRTFIPFTLFVKVTLKWPIDPANLARLHARCGTLTTAGGH
jgi:hypothetical protein